MLPQPLGCHTTCGAGTGLPQKIFHTALLSRLESPYFLC
jgi:hypothetical protein